MREGQSREPLPRTVAARSAAGARPAAAIAQPAVTEASRSASRERLSRAWRTHPVVTFVRHKRTIAFYRQFHALLRAGLGMPVIFAELSKYAPDPAMAGALSAVAAELRDGATLSDAMARHTGMFDDANLELLTFAEEAGKLDPVLARVIEHMEEVHRLRWRAVMMSLWPAYLAGGLIFVGPLFGLASARGAGSLLALYVFGLARNLTLAAGALGAVLGFPLALAQLGLEARWDALKLRLPAVGKAVRDLAASRFVMALGLGVGAGLELNRVLRLSVKATGSPTLVSRLPGMEDSLRQGSSLTDAIDQLALLDRTTLGTLAVAEKTGTLEESLATVSRELQATAMLAMRVLLIALLVVFAGAVLIAIVAKILGTVFGPIKTLYDAAGSGKLDEL
jgi:general secretion pathway protein F